MPLLGFPSPLYLSVCFICSLSCLDARSILLIVLCSFLIVLVYYYLFRFNFIPAVRLCGLNIVVIIHLPLCSAYIE